MKQLMLILMIVLSFGALVGCADEPISGEIKDKEFIPASVQTLLVSHCIYTGTTTITIMMPIIYSYPDRWVIKVENSETREIKDVYVTQECFDSVNIGDWFTYNPEYCSYDEPCTKTPVNDSCVNTIYKLL